MPGRSLSPFHLLLWLLAAAVGVSGWIYGWHWKRVASGSKTTHEEKLIIDLQDQLGLLRAENERLSRKNQETPVVADPSPDADSPPVELPSRN